MEAILAGSWRERKRCAARGEARRCPSVDLAYRIAESIGELRSGECTVRRTRHADGIAWWQLWALVHRGDTGEPFYVGVTVNPLGPYLEVGPSGRRTWGLTPIDTDIWQVSPSIDVLGDRLPDGSRGPSPWHATPRLVGVPASEPWTYG